MLTPHDNEAFADIRCAVEAAENAGDTEYIAGLFAEEAVLMLPDFPVQEGRTACAEFIRDLLPGLLSAFDRRVSYTSAEVSVLGDVALDRGSFSFTVRPKGGGATERVTGKYFWMYARESGRGWKWARVMMSRDEGEADRRPASAAHPKLTWMMGLIVGVAVIGAIGSLVSRGGRDPEDNDPDGGPSR
jgi:ketosteroid isomerase-like protein